MQGGNTKAMCFMTWIQYLMSENCYMDGGCNVIKDSVKIPMFWWRMVG